MRLLLDTHAFVWWLTVDERLSRPAHRAVADDDNDVLISAASAWEITTKYRLGKLPEARTAALDVGAEIANQGFLELPITVEEAARAGSLPGPHRDPFDRLLIAQAMSRNLVLVSIEPLFDRYGVHRLW